MAILSSMATPKIKATYSLDVETVRLLERASERWGVSKSEALRRAIHTAAGSGSGKSERVGLLDRLQEVASISQLRATAWVREARAEREASSRDTPKRK